MNGAGKMAGAVEPSGPSSLCDQVILISGGTAGLGAGIARAVAREGATVAVTGRRREPGEALAAELSAGRAKALFVQADVADVTQARACVAAVITAFGRVDSLVNAAGLTDRGTLLDTTPAVGTNQDAEWFGELDDVHPASAVLTLDGGALAVVSNTRYNARGHDVRLEVHGTRDSLAAGLGPRLPLRSAEPGVSFPDGKPFTFFMDRLAEAFRTELTAFTEVVAGARHRAQFWMRSRPAGWPRPARCRCASTARSRSRKSGSRNPASGRAVPKTALGPDLGRLAGDDIPAAER